MPRQTGSSAGMGTQHVREALEDGRREMTEGFPGTWAGHTQSAALTDPDPERGVSGG